NGLFSVHASLMIFLFIIPAFAGLANFVVPLMLGAADMAFPRLNALSFWLLPIAGVMMLSSFIVGAFAGGWTGYAPLNSDHQPLGAIFFNQGVQWAGASSIMTALNFLVTIITMRAPGMTFWRLPLLVWANFTTSLLVAVATGSKFFSWLATIWEGKLHLRTPMLFALGFVSMFMIGGLSGVMLGAVPIEIHVTATYFIMAHIHYVLFGGSVFTIFAGIYYWFPKMTGRMYDERLGKLHFWLTFVGFNLTFFPMHFIGLQGMPRRVADYADRFADVNLFISIASFGLGASTLVFLYNMARSWAHGPLASGNPWRALTLEWQVSSPPPVFNFDELPQVVGNPYEYGVPGAKHAIFGAPKPEP